jgi:hypothetical protein
MMECVQIYLENGLIEMPLFNLAYRKLVNEISDEMLIFFNSIDKNEWLKVKTVYDNLLDSFPELRKRNISQNIMTRNLKKFCEFYGFNFESSYSGGIGKIKIEVIDELTKPEEECPF